MSGGVGRQAGDLGAWAERAKSITGERLGDVDEAWAALVGLAAAVPPGLSAAHQEVVRRVLDDAWARVLALLVPPVVRMWRPAVDAVADSRVTRALGEIDRRSADSRFKLQTLARQLAVSPSHLTQLLKDRHRSHVRGARTRPPDCRSARAAHRVHAQREGGGEPRGLCDDHPARSALQARRVFGGCRRSTGR
jgi:hypothetical protein